MEIKKYLKIKKINLTKIFNKIVSIKLFNLFSFYYLFINL